MASKKKSTKKSAAKKKTTAKKPAGGAKKTAAPKKKAKAKPKPARIVPKVSLLRGTNVDDWAKKLTGWQADALKIIRALVSRHAPDSTLVMKWGQPVWEHNGPFAWLRPAAKHVSFGFWRGAEMNDPDGHLEGDGDRMRHLKVTSPKDLDSLPIEGFVKQAVALNGSKGDPTKRN
ncbi:MAG: hypothetical protein JWP87_2291 [Labilithrix sp.]|nr:hypothetical protein [Labilithrix sp.]